jgi:hypothetical protein
MKPTIILAVFLILTSCGNDDYIDITDQCTFINIFSPSCFVEPSGEDNNEYIFKDSSNYLSFIDTNRLNSSSINCDTASALTIDFENYVLLGKYAEGGGCSVNFKKRIYRDIINQEIIYKIDVKASGWCDMLVYSNNWVLIPKSLFYEDVIFSVDE